MIDTVIHGDALATLKGFPDNYVDSIVCDPPAGISFMSKSWDSNKGERDAWIAWLRDIMSEAKRTLKPGGHALVWALPRTSHWTATALEDAGFEVRDAVFHHFGSGFPKSTAIDKQIDKMLGKEREVISTRLKKSSDFTGGNFGAGNYPDKVLDITKPATPEAAQWAGYGTALKPSTEIWWLVRKPLAESSIAANVLAWGTGGLNIGQTRVGNEQRINKGMSSLGVMHDDNWQPKEVESVTQGRWPSHLLLSHSIWCIPQGVKRVRGNAPQGKPSLGSTVPNGFLAGNKMISGCYTDPEGMETVEAYQCHESCPIRELDLQSGVRKSGGMAGKEYQAQEYNGAAYGHINARSSRSISDQGGASRYFQHFPPDDYTPFGYFSKASRAERNAGCEGLPLSQPENHSSTLAARMENGIATNKRTDTPRGNSHPTVKSLALMRWLIRLITPPGGVVLDMFGGSGSTAVAAIQEGKHFILIEQDESYTRIAQARIAHATQDVTQATSGEYDCAPDCPIRILGEQSGVSVSRKGAGPSYGKAQGVHEGWRRPSHENYQDKPEAGYNDKGTAARFFTQFPPDSLFSEIEEAAV